MSNIDIILLLPIVYGLVRGLMRGVVKEVSAIVSVVLGIIMARLFANDMTMFLHKYLSWDLSVLQVVSYGLLFLLVTLALNLTAVALSKLLQVISMGWLNRLLGALFGAIKWALVLSIIVNGILVVDGKFGFLKKDIRKETLLVEPLEKVAKIAWEEINIQTE